MECGGCRSSITKGVCTSCLTDEIRSRRERLSAAVEERKALEDQIAALLQRNKDHEQKWIKYRTSRNRNEQLHTLIEEIEESNSKNSETVTEHRFNISYRKNKVTEALKVLHSHHRRLVAETTDKKAIQPLITENHVISEKLSNRRFDLCRSLKTLFPISRSIAGEDRIFISSETTPLPLYGDISAPSSTLSPELMAASFGNIVQILELMANYLNTPLPFPIKQFGSLSTISDLHKQPVRLHLQGSTPAELKMALTFLTADITHLCASQRVPIPPLPPSIVPHSASIPPKHPIQLLWTLLSLYQCEQLGRDLSSSPSHVVASPPSSSLHVSAQGRKSPILEPQPLIAKPAPQPAQSHPSSSSEMEGSIFFSPFPSLASSATSVISPVSAMAVHPLPASHVSHRLPQPLPADITRKPPPAPHAPSSLSSSSLLASSVTSSLSSFVSGIPIVSAAIKSIAPSIASNPPPPAHPRPSTPHVPTPVVASSSSASLSNSNPYAAFAASSIQPPAARPPSPSSSQYFSVNENFYNSSSRHQQQHQRDLSFSSQFSSQMMSQSMHEGVSSSFFDESDDEDWEKLVGDGEEEDESAQAGASQRKP